MCDVSLNNVGIRTYLNQFLPSTAYLSGDIIEHTGPPNKINFISKSIFLKFEAKTRPKNDV